MYDKLQPRDLIVRRLHTSDQAEICDHFLRLDIQSRRARFCGSVSDDTALKYARDIFRADSIVCGAVVRGRLRGLVELRGLFHAWPATTEAAFSVEHDWQNIGIGDALFGRMFAMARNRGVRTIQMVCLKENGRMRHLAKKHHALLHNESDATEAVLHPYWPTPRSVVTEIIGETRGHAYRLFGRTSTACGWIDVLLCRVQSPFRRVLHPAFPDRAQTIAIGAIEKPVRKWKGFHRVRTSSDP